MGLIGKFIAVEAAKAIGVAVSKKIDKKETAKRSTEQIVQGIIFDNVLFAKHDSDGMRYDSAKYILKDVDGKVIYRTKSERFNGGYPLVYLMDSKKNQICSVSKDEFETDKYGDRYIVSYPGTYKCKYMYRLRKSLNEYEIEIEEEKGFIHKTKGIFWSMKTADKIINFEANVWNDKGEEVARIHSTADEQQDDGYILEYKYPEDIDNVIWIAVAAMISHGKY